ncbi:anti-sigma factor antagonist [Pseudonocardia sp. GCM10023141]|uniref:anti-sigma factor antagonist n=1 Tax=Pseudonocardia sp. GCM10023141 TaxID=3252653 RepID=UPI003610FF3B
MDADTPGEKTPADGLDVGEIIRFDVVDHGPGVRVLHVVGELDTLTAPLLNARLQEQQAAARHIVLDLTDVTFLGSAGLAVLVGAKDAADAAGGRLWVVPGSRIVKRAMEATGLLPHFAIADDVPEALAAAR